MRFRLTILVFLVLFCYDNRAAAQWSTVAPNLLEVIPSSSGGFGSIAFKDGVVWVGRTAIWKSLDSGVTWTLVNSAIGGTITEIKFYDKNTGVVATTSGVFLTTNQGQSWTRILNHASFGASFAGSAQNIVAVCDGNGFFYSNDGGTTWKSQNPATHLLCILGKSDGTAYGFGGSDATSNGGLFSTSDFGATWQGSSITDYDSFSLAEDSCDGTIYRMNEEGHIKTNNLAQFYSTSTKGALWVSKASHPGTYYCASIAISPNAIFCATLSNGIERSVDQGATWINIGGPSNNIDTRLLSAINDNIIIAADGNGNIWRTTNSGGFPLNLKVMPTFQIPAISISACTSILSNVLASLSNCRHLRLESAVLEGANLNNFTLKPKTFPYDLNARSIDSFSITFDPKNQSGVYTINLHITGTYPSTGQPFDTIITIQAIAKPSPPLLIADRPTLNYNKLSTCDPSKDSVFVLTNEGCDSLTIISGPGSVDPSFTIDSIPLPLTIPPGGSVLVHVHCRSKGQGPVTSIANYVAHRKGLTTSVQVQLEFNGLQGVDKLFLGSNKINFNPLSFCNTDSLRRFFVNPGCDTLVIDSAALSGDPDFLAQIGPLPIILPPGDTIDYIVRFVPVSKGTKTAYIRISAHDIYGGLNSIDTSVIMSGIVKTSSVVFYTPSPHINFGTVSYCNPDSLARFFVNKGCDTLVIDSAALSGDPDFLAQFGHLPIILAPGDTVRYKIHLGPLSKGAKKGLITISGYDLQRNTTIIDTTIDISAVVSNGSQVLSLPSLSINFDSLSSCSIGDTILHLKNPGCDTLFIIPDQISGDRDFSIDPLTEIAIPPNDSTTIDIKLIPQKPGSRNAQLHLLVGSFPNIHDTVINLSGFIGDDLQKFSLSAKLVDFDSTSICDTKDTLISITNTGCDSLQVSSAYLDGDPDFTFSGFDSSLATEESGTYKITLTPRQLGIRNARLHLTIGSGANKKDTVLDFTGVITKGIGTLSTSINTCNFGTTTICQERDTMITLHNTGCDTLIISGIAATQTGFATTVTFPIIIPPGKDTTIEIRTRIDTTNGKILNTTNLTFLSNSKPALPPILLSRGISYPINVAFVLVPEQIVNTTANEARFKLKVNTVPLTGVSTVDFMLNYNSDLLEYNTSSGLNTVTATNASFFHISGNPFISVDADSTIAELIFNAYLTKDSLTDISIQNPRLNSADPFFEACVASVSADSTLFHYQYFCGERSIAGFLRNNDELVITSIRPDPVQDFFEVHFRSAITQNAKIEVVNLLGNTLTGKDQLLHEGENIISFRIPAVSEGMYFIRATSSSTIVSQPFIHMK